MPRRPHDSAVVPNGIGNVPFSGFLFPGLLLFGFSENNFKLTHYQLPAKVDCLIRRATIEVADIASTVHAVQFGR
jgi:hypothetical protein